MGQKRENPGGEEEGENEGGENDKQGTSHQKRMNEKEKHRIKTTTTTEGQKK